MKFSISFFISFTLFSLNTIAQDGSDIRYVNIENIDTSYIEKTVHLDFYNQSFFSRKRDTVIILVNNKPVSFVEHREDNGFNNWFSRQYLEEIGNKESEYLRITSSVIKDITKDSILVTSHFDLINNKNSLLQGKSFTQDIWFKRNILSQILIQSEQCCK
jgi:hypothetical protein